MDFGKLPNLFFTHLHINECRSKMRDTQRWQPWLWNKLEKMATLIEAAIFEPVNEQKALQIVSYYNVYFV